MKLKTLFCGIAAAAMFTACSSDEPIQGPGEGGNNGGNNPDGTGYITVGINLPTVPSSRGINDNFENGTANEYAVDNAMLLLFTGDGESDAKLHSAYNLVLDSKADGMPGDNLTTSYMKTVKVKGVGEDQHLWGLVMLNYDGVVDPTFSTADGETHVVSSLKVNAKEMALGDNGTTFQALAYDITSVNFLKEGTDGKTHFFMTNSPVSVAKEGGASWGGATAADINTLTEFGFGRNVVKPTEEEAKVAPAASFYVERALAKATLKANDVNIPVGSDLDLTGLQIESVEWVLDNIEPNSYIVRNMGTADYLGYSNARATKDKFRMIGSNMIGQTAIQPVANLYRTYWCIDPQYNAATPTMNTHGAYQEAGVDNPQYCHENTFDVDHMDYANTTRALIKVTFKNKEGKVEDFYIVNGDMRTLYNKKDAESHLIAGVINSTEVRTAFQNALKPVEGGNTLTITNENYSDYMQIVIGEDANNVSTITSIAFALKDGVDNPYKDGESPTIEDDALKTLITQINAANNIVRYAGGVAYYEVRFKHFGDESTPWSNTTGVTVDTTAKAYAGNSNYYLGRYGMVRNNWYELELSSIKKLGKPVEGQLTVDGGKPDDNEEVEQWLSFNVNLLAWAKRVQNIEL